jgi:hypothetical protein
MSHILLIGMYEVEHFRGCVLQTNKSTSENTWIVLGQEQSLLVKKSTFNH